MGFKLICNECGEMISLIEKFKDKGIVENIEVFEDYEGILIIKCKKCGNSIEIYI